MTKPEQPFVVDDHEDGTCSVTFLPCTGCGSTETKTSTHFGMDCSNGCGEKAWRAAKALQLAALREKKKERADAS